MAIKERKKTATRPTVDRIVQRTVEQAAELTLEQTLEAAVTDLCRKDKKLARVMSTVGPCNLVTDQMQSPFHALAESIVYQQLSGKAAATIFGRVRALCKQSGTLRAEEMQQISIEELRAAGCSQAKALAIKDLADKTVSGVVPGLDQMHTLSDQELIERLISIRGVGQWTIEMLMIFRLGRLDILPSTDYGVRKGFALTYGLPELPAPKAIMAFGERWRPHRTVASWYMWRALELPAEFWAPRSKKVIVPS